MRGEIPQGEIPRGEIPPDFSIIDYQKTKNLKKIYKKTKVQKKRNIFFFKLLKFIQKKKVKIFQKEKWQKKRKNIF